MSGEPLPAWPVSAYHHPYQKSGLGGRSSDNSALLVPSATWVL
jgi:hypothetical protein